VYRACEGSEFFHGMHAFALEENEKFDEAAASVERALSITQHDPWSIHVQAHLFYARGQLSEGIHWLEDRQQEWSQCMSFLNAHSWFHVALLRLDLDEMDNTRAIWDEHVWPWHSREQKGAAAAAAADGEAEAPIASPAAAASASQGAEFSFGIPCTPLSFPRHDRSYVEDQNAALNLLWRLELRMCSTATAAATPSSRSATDAALSAAPASPLLPLHSASLTSRWHSVFSALHSPPQQLLSLFGLLQLYALCRLGKLQEAKEVQRTMERQVAETADEQTREALQG
jgi:hypothetical protein